jgi:hypothetical protein
MPRASNPDLHWMRNLGLAKQPAAKPAATAAEDRCAAGALQQVPGRCPGSRPCCPGGRQRRARERA